MIKSKVTEQSKGRVSQRTGRILRIFEEAVAGTLMVALFALLVFQVVSRYIFGNPAPWTEELSRFVFIWMIFIGAAYLASQNKHLAVTMLSDILPSGPRKLLMRFIGAVTALGAFIVAYQGLGFVERTATLLSPGAGLPMAVVYVACVIGFALIGIHAVVVVFTGGVDTDDEELLEVTP